jgi:hypothetical protein
MPKEVTFNEGAEGFSKAFCRPGGTELGVCPQAITVVSARPKIKGFKGSDGGMRIQPLGRFILLPEGNRLK